MLFILSVSLPLDLPAHLVVQTACVALMLPHLPACCELPVRHHGPRCLNRRLPRWPAVMLSAALRHCSPASGPAHPLPMWHKP